MNAQRAGNDPGIFSAVADKNIKGKLIFVLLWALGIMKLVRIISPLLLLLHKAVSKSLSSHKPTPTGMSYRCLAMKRRWLLCETWLLYWLQRALQQLAGRKQAQSETTQDVEEWVSVKCPVCKCVSPRVYASPDLCIIHCDGYRDRFWMHGWE